ncbi:MAG: RNA polymerase sigma factor [Solirubrobacteraceae bacterium]
MTTPAVQHAVDAAFREEWGRIVATLIRRTGDWDLAEECAQEAFAEALRRWPRDGIPRRTGAWLTTVAGSRAIDRLRHARMRDARLRQAAASMTGRFEDEDVTVLDEGDESGIEDDRLRLIFTCCHPALPLEGRVALTLRALAGLTTTEIANAFLVPEPTMAKRLVRAKHKIQRAGIPYRVPPAHLLAERSGGVLGVLYLMFNEGYAASTGDDQVRVDLCQEAIRLARVLSSLMPDEPEVGGLLALMLFQHSRREARTDAAGDIVTLEEQDRSRWNRAEIEQANAILGAAVRRDAVGPYQAQALIAACHANAADADATDWARIAGLYEQLLEVTANPFVKLNHAVAVGMAKNPEDGLELVDRLAASGELCDYHLLHATRADFLRRLGRNPEAAEAYRESLKLARTEAERRYLSRRLEEIRTRPTPAEAEGANGAT